MRGHPSGQTSAWRKILFFSATGNGEHAARSAACLRCLHRCPKFAISHGRKTAGHGRYVHP